MSRRAQKKPLKRRVENPLVSALVVRILSAVARQRGQVYVDGEVRECAF